MANFILVLIAIAIITFIWLMWLRHVLAHHLREVEKKYEVLKADLNKRRDTVPYLLESYRKVKQPEDNWHKVLGARRKFKREQDLEEEWNFEKELMNFVNEASADTSLKKSLNFLEAKKDIRDLTNIIEKEKNSLQSAKRELYEKKKRFPYSLASAIFGLRKIGV